MRAILNHESDFIAEETTVTELEGAGLAGVNRES